MIVHEDNFLEILKDVGPKLELEAKTVKSAQAFQAIPGHIITISICLSLTSFAYR